MRLLTPLPLQTITVGRSGRMYHSGPDRSFIVPEEQSDDLSDLLNVGCVVDVGGALIDIDDIVPIDVVTEERETGEAF